jgi:hypothetical protein
MAKHDNLEKEFDRFIDVKAPGGAQNFGDERTVNVLGLLGKAVSRLDTTSTRLARINIWLTAVILLVGFVQIVLMLRGK